MDLPDDPAAWSLEPTTWPDGTPGWRLERPGVELGIFLLAPTLLEVALLNQVLFVGPDGRLARHEETKTLVASDQMPTRRGPEDPVAWALRAAAMAAGAPAQALSDALGAIALAWAADQGQEVFVSADVGFDLSAVRTDGPGDRLLRRISTGGALREALILLCTPARRQRPPRGARLDVRRLPPETAHGRAAALAGARHALEALPADLHHQGLSDLLPPGA